MSRPEPKGWCPGALAPMMSGDGLVVRIRPHLGRFTREQALALCEAASSYGSGIIEFTSRANVQLRGVTMATHPALIAALENVDLIDREANIEARRNIVVTPLWQPNDDTVHLAEELIARLDELPDLPTKFGFAVDAGPAPMLSNVSADVRVERAECGSLIVRVDGAPFGSRVEPNTAVDEILAVCHWFATSGGLEAGRMARHLRSLGGGAERSTRSSLSPAASTSPLEVGAVSIGTSARAAIYGVAFGRTNAAALGKLIRQSKATALRVTPWRQLLLEDVDWIETDNFICSRSDPRTLIDACPGAPFCGSSTVDIEGLAGALAEIATERLHLSGCRKGCAHAAAAPIAIVGTEGRFDVVRDGRAWDVPEQTGLTSQDVVEFFRGR